MASDAQNTQRWESTSAPVINHDKSADRWRLELNYTPKKKKTTRKRSAWYTTREEAEASASWWRLSWEQGNNGKKINPGTQPDEPRSNSSGSSPADVELPPGKSERSVGRLNRVQELQFKRQRKEGSSMSRGEWMKSTLLTTREKRCLQRAWKRREARLDKNFQNRHAHLYPQQTQPSHPD